MQKQKPLFSSSRVLRELDAPQLIKHHISTTPAQEEEIEVILELGLKTRSNKLNCRTESPIGTNKLV